MSVDLLISNPKFITKDAVFAIKSEVRVKDSRPVNDSRELFRHEFIVRSDRQTLQVPRHVLDESPFAYESDHIEIRCFGELVINDKLIRKDTSVQKDLPLQALEKPSVDSKADELIEPKDIFSFSKNLMVIPLQNKVATLGLLIVGLVVIGVNMVVGIHDQLSPETSTYLYSHRDSDGDSSSPLAKALAGSSALGAAIWFAIRRQLRKYMTFEFKPISGSIDHQTTCVVSDLVHGVSRTDLDNVTLRIVACNMERGQYLRGSGSNRRTVSFSEPAHGVLLSSKTVKLISKSQPVENHFRDSMSFEPMFKVLYPSNEVSESHGLFIYWEVQLIHDDFVDQELKGETGIFQREDFFSA